MTHRNCEDCGKAYYANSKRTCRIEIVQTPFPHLRNYCPVCQRYCFNMTGPWTLTRNQMRAETEFKSKRKTLQSDK